MTDKRKISFGLLLLLATLLLMLALLPGQSFARYYAGANWNAVIHDTSQTIPILTKNTKTISIPTSISEDVVCITEKMDADGAFAEFTSEGLVATVTGENAIITLGEVLPPAGTYRLVIRSTDGETVFQTVIFFINYSDG